ncbi:hypothetical protein SDC9_177792 [bioreactor metagenome]|uniref:Uncharacterized protein n=1 Tax=bioreactor metagenome TaxID=1076179 RepID=A0A645GTY0_9ZZZZ
MAWNGDQRHVDRPAHQVLVYDRIIPEQIVGVDLYVDAPARPRPNALGDLPHQLGGAVFLRELSREAQCDLGGRGGR